MLKLIHGKEMIFHPKWNHITILSMKYYHFERINYSRRKEIISVVPNQLLVDYSTNLNYMHISEMQQCSVMNASTHSMGTINEIFFQFGANNSVIQFQYTGITSYAREHFKCHRWIGQRDFNTSIQQNEWYCSAEYNEIDLSEFIPIRVNVKTMYKVEPLKVMKQKISRFHE